LEADRSFLLLSCRKGFPLLLSRLWACGQRGRVVHHVQEDGLIRPVNEGTPQGGPLSPFLSNIVLDDLDKELARRGHRFCRYR
jgi:hypothetical protein